MTETSGNRSLMLGRFYNPRDRLISRRTFAAAKIDLAVGGERIAIVTIGSGVGGRGMTGDQMIDRKRVLDCAQTVFQRVTCTHVCCLRWSMLVREPQRDGHRMRPPGRSASHFCSRYLWSWLAGSHSANRKHLQEFVIEPLTGASLRSQSCRSCPRACDHLPTRHRLRCENSA